MLTDHTEIKKWLAFHNINLLACTISNDGVVDVASSAWIRIHTMDTLSVQFGLICGNFRIIDGASVKSFHGFPWCVRGDMSLAGSRVYNLSGLHKVVHQVDGSFHANVESTHILGLLLIKGITHFQFSTNTQVAMTQRIPLDAIMNKYRGTDDLISAQDEMIDAGYIEQAKL